MEGKDNKLICIAEDNNISIGLVKKYYNIIKNNPNTKSLDEYYLLRCLNLLIILREQNSGTLNIVTKQAIDKVNSNILKLKKS